MSKMNTMDTIKELLKSKTIWGVILLVLNGTLFKDNPLTDQFGDQVNGAIDSILTTVGAVLAVWGRLTAKAPLIGRPV